MATRLLRYSLASPARHFPTTTHKSVLPLIKETYSLITTHDLDQIEPIYALKMRLDKVIEVDEDWSSKDVSRPVGDT